MQNIDIVDFSSLKPKKKAKPDTKPKADDKPALGGPETDKALKVTEAAQPSTFEDPYKYDFLLQRIYGFLKENNPSLAEKKNLTMKPPQVVKLSGKRCAWVNFAEICKTMARAPEHVSQYFLTELGTEGTVSGEQLILKGKYMPKHIESLIKKYIIEFVSCSTCKSAKTTITKDSNTRLYMMKCDLCGCSRSVTSIKSGHTALKKGDRIKAKENK